MEKCRPQLITRSPTLSAISNYTINEGDSLTIALSGQDQNPADTLTYTVKYEGLSGPAVAAHIHGPADPGANAPPVVPFANAASPITGTATLTDAQAADLKAGKYYVNVHTAANKGGEIRGQITAKK